MLIAYDSMTGNNANFIQRIGMRAVRIEENLRLTEPFILLTYTTGFGQVPRKTQQFLKNNHLHLQGVAASGNKAWGDNFAISADKIANQYGVPIILKYEMRGTPEDEETFKERVQTIRYETDCYETH